MFLFILSYLPDTVQPELWEFTFIIVAGVFLINVSLGHAENSKYQAGIY